MRARSAQDPLRWGSDTVLFIDNPTIAARDGAVAILGGAGLLYPVVESGDALSIDTTAIRRIFGYWRPSGDSSRIIPTTALHLGSAGIPVVTIAEDGGVDVIWRTAVMDDANAPLKLVQGRWIGGEWRGVRPMLDGMDGDLLTQLQTSRTVDRAGEAWAFVHARQRQRTRAFVLRHRDTVWQIDTARVVEALSPSIVVLDDRRMVVVGLAGREPYGNTVVSYSMDERRPAVVGEARVSSPKLPVVQKPFAYRSSLGVGVIFAGGLADREDHFFAMISPDSGRTWIEGGNFEVGGSILAWDATHDEAGRAVLLANVATPSTEQGTELRLLLYEPAERSWQSLWRDRGNVTAFGVPAITFDDGRLHLAFSADSRRLPGSPETHLLSFDLVCPADFRSASQLSR